MMCCDTKNMATQSGTGKRTSALRLIALAIIACIVAASLLSGAFILTHAGHEHDHNGPGGACTTCAQLLAAENILKQLSATPAAAFVIVAGAYASISHLCAAAPASASYTPVGLKVRLNH